MQNKSVYIITHDDHYLSFESRIDTRNFKIVHHCEPVGTYDSATQFDTKEEAREILDFCINRDPKLSTAKIVDLDSHIKYLEDKANKSAEVIFNDTWNNTSVEDQRALILETFDNGGIKGLKKLLDNITVTNTKENEDE